MVLNQTGKTVDRWWSRTEKKFPHVEPGEHVLMPNHMRGVVAIVGTAPRRGCPTDPRVRPKRENRKSNEYQRLRHQRYPENQQHQKQGGHTGPPLRKSNTPTEKSETEKTLDSGQSPLPQSELMPE